MVPVQAAHLQGDDEIAQYIEKKTLLQLKEQVDHKVYKLHHIEIGATLTKNSISTYFLL